MSISTSQLVGVLENNKNGINSNYVQSVLGLDINEFYTKKSAINRNLNKWKNVQIVRIKVRGNSIWKLARFDPQASMKYNNLREKQIISACANSFYTGLIAMANEHNKAIRQKMVTQMGNRQQKVLQAIVSPQNIK